MKVRVVLNGYLKTFVQGGEIELRLERQSARVDDVFDAFAHAVGISRAQLSSTVAAVNDTLVSREHPVLGGDVLFLLPPISGG